MSANAKKMRLDLRARLNSGIEAELLNVEKIREFVFREIPDLDYWSPWTPDQIRAVARIMIDYERDPRWLCPHDCGRVVPRFGEQCQLCLVSHGKLGPVDWDSLGC